MENHCDFRWPNVCQVGDSNVTKSLLMSDTGYVDESIDVFEPYDIRLLHPIPKSISMMAWRMPRNLQIAVRPRPVGWFPRCWRRPSSRSLIMYCRIPFRNSRQSLFLPMFQSFLYQNDIGSIRRISTMESYCARCKEEEAGQRNNLNETVW